MSNYNLKNIISTIVGVAFIGIGVGILNLSNFGVDPYCCMNYGISGVIGLSFGTWQMILNIILFIPMLVLGRKYIGLGSICNMFGVGYIAQFVSYIASLLGYPTIDFMVARIIVLIIGVCIICLGCAVYTMANLGIAPYDALAYIVEELIHGKIKFKWIRVITDIVCVAIGFITGSVVGISTVILMFFTGPLIQFFKDILAPLFKDNSTESTDATV